MFHHGDAGYPKHFGKLIRRHLERTGSRPYAGDGLRIGSRASRVESHVAFDLLHDLVDVTVEYGDRAEAAQLAHELIRITRTPTPRLIDRPQRHMGEDDDGRTGGFALQVRGQPRDLIGAQRAETARLELQYVD